MSDEREALVRDLAAVMHEEYYKGGTSISRMASAAVAAGWRRSPAPVDGHEAGWQAGNNAAAQRCRDAGGYGPAFADAISAVPYSAAAQPADAAVIERAREIVAEWGASGDESRAEEEAYTMSRAFLAEHARAEAREAGVM